MESSIWIDDDLLQEILKRLPIKSLGRFLSVCKSWKSLISNSSFINLHYSLNVSTTPPSHKPYLRGLNRDLNDDYFLCRPQEIHIKHQLHVPFRFPVFSDLDDDFKKFSFVDTIQGVVCASYSFESSFDSTILWNPTIHKYFTLPWLPFSFLEPLCLDFSHAEHFDGIGIGFGYDSSKNDFKVVRIRMPINPVNTRSESLLTVYEVYSVREGIWRAAITENIECCEFYSTREGCYVNGSVHWLVSTPDFHTHSVLVFDIESEVFKTMELPEEVLEEEEDELVILGLLVYGGMLSVVTNWDADIVFWVMEEHGDASSWNKLYEITIEMDSNDISNYQYQTLSPYGPNEWMKFPLNDCMFDDILGYHVYEETLLLMDHTEVQSYGKEEIVHINC